jgi:hypothetical protein
MAHPKLPQFAAWQHREARDGFEVVFFREKGGGYRFEGSTAALDAGEAWAVDYMITLDADWLTRSARVRGHSTQGKHEVALEADGRGSWRIDGSPAPYLDGCLDIDLESSACTNALPVHRLGLRIGDSAEAPAAYVRATDLLVERLEQHYTRTEDTATHHRYTYTAPRFGFECQLIYDEFGLVLDYPGLAVRAL